MNRKKRILFVITNLHIGGIQKSLVNLLSEISSNYEITLLLFSKTGDYICKVPSNIKMIEGSFFLRLLGVSQKEAKEEGALTSIIRAAFVVYTKLVNNYLPIRLLTYKKHKLGKFDYAISFYDNANRNILYGGCNEFVLHSVNADKKIAFIHCDFLKCNGNTSYNKKIYSKFDMIATCSKGTKQQFLKAFPELDIKTYIVPNCHNYSEIISLANDIPFSYESNLINIITVARLSKEKGIERAIEVISKFINCGYKIHYHIIGSGPLLDKLIDIVRKKNIEQYVTLYGEKTNPYRFMKNADLFLLTSYHEAAPMVFDEAKCLGLPIFATETISTQEMVIDFNAGWICENSIEGIEKSLKCILDKKKEIYDLKEKLLKNDNNNKKAVMQFENMLNGRE